MELKNQVASLELSKQLNKLLGDKAPESLFYWCEDQRDYEWGVWTDDQIRHEVKTKENFESYPAYTVAELGELLPSWISTHKSIADEDAGNIAKGFVCVNENMKLGEPKYQHSKTEANARAKMLIYLLENKLLTPKKQ